MDQEMELSVLASPLMNPFLKDADEGLGKRKLVKHSKEGVHKRLFFFDYCWFHAKYFLMYNAFKGLEVLA